MKKLLIALAAVVIAALAAVLLVLPDYLGKKAEESLAEQQKLLSQASFLTVESHRYERGWFSATETTVVRLKPSLLHNMQQYLPDNLKTVLQEPITIINHVSHGPFAGSLTPVRARVHTEFQYQPEAAKVLARFFGTQAPVQMNNTVYLNGAGEIELSVPAFDYEELSGIKLAWQGLSGTTAYENGFSAYSHDYTAPLLHAKLADQGDVVMEKLHIRSHTADGSNRLALGATRVIESPSRTPMLRASSPPITTPQPPDTSRDITGCILAASGVTLASCAGSMPRTREPRMSSPRAIRAWAGTKGAAPTTAGFLRASLASTFQSGRALPRASNSSTCATTDSMRSRTSFWKPFITDKTMIRAATPSAMPMTDTPEMKEMNPLRRALRPARV